MGPTLRSVTYVLWNGKGRDHSMTLRSATYVPWNGQAIAHCVCVAWLVYGARWACYGKPSDTPNIAQWDTCWLKSGVFSDLYSVLEFGMMEPSLLVHGAMKQTWSSACSVCLLFFKGIQMCSMFVAMEPMKQISLIRKRNLHSCD
jgi:hypothetical protein